MKRILLAGLLIALCCLVVPVMAVAANYAFVPNMGVDVVNSNSPTDQAATVSKVDAVSNVEIARYYMAPRYHQLVDALGDTSTIQFPYYPGDWRTNRLIVSPDGDAWVLNTGADEYAKAITIQGTVVRIQGETIGLGDTNGDGTIQTATTTIPLTFGTDDAVTVFAVGAPGDIPRTINFDIEGNLWIGFHKAGSKFGYFQKYTYNACDNTLNAIPDGYATTLADPRTGVRLDIAPYNADIDKNGILWFASYGSGRINRNTGSTNSDDGMYSFDTNNPAAGMTKYDMANLAADTAYGVLVDDSPAGTDVNVYATSLEGGAFMWIYHSTTPLAGFTRVTVTGGNGLRGLAFDNYGTIWIASSNNPGAVCWYNPDDGTSGTYTGLGSTPVGVGKDYAGDMWIVVRNSNKLFTFTPPVAPSSGTLTTLGGVNVSVGPWPYVYGDFVRDPVNNYQICGYKYDANTELGWAGWTINLYKKVGGAFPAEPDATQVTGADGSYCFTGLDAGYYKVTETIDAELGYPVDPENNERLVTLPDYNPACETDEPGSYDFTNLPITTECATGWAAPSVPLTPRFVLAPGDWATYVDTYDKGEGSASTPVVYPIFAGQTYHAGDVYVYDSAGMLYVKYVPFANDDAYKPEYCGGWEMNAYHLQVVDEFDGFNPYRTYNKKTKTFQKAIPGQFNITYEGDLIPGTDYIKIDISSYTDNDLYIAAHAGMCWQGYPCDVFDPTP